MPSDHMNTNSGSKPSMPLEFYGLIFLAFGFVLRYRKQKLETRRKLSWRSLSSLSLDDSEALTAFDKQVGGHKYEEGKTGMLATAGCVLKPFQDRGRGELEAAFYETVKKNAKDASLAPQERQLWKELQKFLPVYHGAKTIEMDGIPTKYLVLRDVTDGFVKPSIMDIKMGTKTYQPDAPAEKRDYEISKFKYQEDIGFRIDGMRVYNNVKDDFHVYGKNYGRMLTPESMPDAFKSFFYDGKSVRIAAAEKVLSRVKALEAWFTTQHQLHFIASSLLIVYDGKAASEDIQVVMIDFCGARTQGVSSIDEGYLKGLHSLRKFLEQLITGHKTS